MSERELAVNASPWIFLGKLGRSELLRITTPNGAIPSSVIEEVRAGVVSSEPPDLQILPPWLKVLEDVPVPLEIAAWDLGAGESQVLARVSERPGRIAMDDDLQARRCASILGLPDLGTLGIILLAKSEGLLERARPLVERLLDVGLYLLPDLVRTALAEVGE